MLFSPVEEAFREEVRDFEHHLLQERGYLEEDGVVEREGEDN